MIGSWLGSGGLAMAAAISLSACVSTSPPPPAASNKTLSLERRLEALVPWLLERHRVPGAAVAVIEGERVLIRGWGLRRADGPLPIGPDTVFEAASLGKPLFAYAVMKLAATGFDLDRPLAAELDKPYIEDDERVLAITARQALSHTTGFPNWRPDHATPNPGPLRIISDPGSKFSYSGEGYLYLQRAIEARTGVGIETFMQGTTLQPLGMSRSGYVWSDHFLPDLAAPHGALGTAAYKSRPLEAKAPATLHTTVRDFTAFVGQMLNAADRVAGDMLQPQVEPKPPFAWSLGWGLERRPEGHWFWQWGDNIRFMHFVMGSRSQRRAVVVLTNGLNGAHVFRAVVEAALGFLPAALDSSVIRY